MHRRLKSFEQRLARIAAFLRAGNAEAERAQSLGRARKVMASLIREGLRRAGPDPDESRALRALETPQPPPPRHLVWRPPDAREELLAEAQKLADRMRGRPPRLASASPMELFAYYCLGEGAERQNTTPA
jgi:hypothetical protein